MADFPAIARAAPVGRQGFRRPAAQRGVPRRHYGEPHGEAGGDAEAGGDGPRKAGPRWRTCAATAQVSRIDSSSMPPDDTEVNVQILLDNQPGCAVQPQFAGYFHDMAERHAKVNATSSRLRKRVALRVIADLPAIRLATAMKWQVPIASASDIQPRYKCNGIDVIHQVHTDAYAGSVLLYIGDAGRWSRIGSLRGDLFKKCRGA
jgi:hypothetical protein